MTETELAFGIEIELPWSVMLDRVDVEAAEILRASGGFIICQSLNELEYHRASIS